MPLETQTGTSSSIPSCDIVWGLFWSDECLAEGFHVPGTGKDDSHPLPQVMLLLPLSTPFLGLISFTCQMKGTSE